MLILYYHRRIDRQTYQKYNLEPHKRAITLPNAIIKCKLRDMTDLRLVKKSVFLHRLVENLISGKNQETKIRKFRGFLDDPVAGSPIFRKTFFNV
jgi:hypothetical protein